MTPKVPLRSLCLGLLAPLLLSPSAEAAAITVFFSGNTESVQGLPDPSSGNSLYDSLYPAVAPGSPFFGSFTYDNGQPNSNNGQFSFSIPPDSLNVSLGDFFHSVSGAAQSSFQIDTFTNPGDEPPNVGVSAAVDFSAGLNATFQIYLKDPFGHPLASTDLNAIQWDLSLFPQHEASFVFQDDSSNSVRVFGHLTNLVPEPASLVLFGAAALALAARGFRRARR